MREKRYEWKVLMKDIEQWIDFETFALMWVTEQWNDIYVKSFSFFQIVVEQKRQNVVKRFESSDKCHLPTFLTTSIHIGTNKQHTKKVKMNIWSHITLNFHVVQVKTLVSQNYDIFRLLLLLWYVSRKRHFFFVFERGHIHCVRHCNISCYFILFFLRERMLFSPFFAKF